MDAVTYIQKRFYQDYPPHSSEKDYLFADPSTMKPTQIKVSSYKYALTDVCSNTVVVSQYHCAFSHINIFTVQSQKYEGVVLPSRQKLSMCEFVSNHSLK